MECSSELSAHLAAQCPDVGLPSVLTSGPEVLHIHCNTGILALPDTLCPHSYLFRHWAYTSGNALLSVLTNYIQTIMHAHF